MSMKKVLPMLLERDNYKCGIHYGGCGKDIKQEDIDAGNVNVDHIIPKTLFKHKSNQGASVFMKDYFRQPTHASCNSIDKRGQLTSYPEFTCDCHYTYYNVETDTVELYFQHHFKHNGTMEWRKETFTEKFISRPNDKHGHKIITNNKIVSDITMMIGKKGNWHGFQRDGDMGSIFPRYKTSDLYICYLMNILSLLKCKRLDEAKQEYSKYIEFIDTEDSYSRPDLLDEVSELFDSLSSLSDTEELWFKILHILNPKAYHYRISDKKYQVGDIFKHIKHLRKAIALESDKAPKIFVAYSNLGYAYTCVGNYKESEKYLLKAVELNAGYKMAKGNLAHLYQTQGMIEFKAKRYTEALEFFIRAKDALPDVDENFYNIACTYYNMNNLTDAIKYLKNGLKIHPDSVVLKGKLNWIEDEMKTT